MTLNDMFFDNLFLIIGALVLMMGFGFAAVYSIRSVYKSFTELNK